MIKRVENVEPLIGRVGVGFNDDAIYSTLGSRCYILLSVVLVH